METTMKAGQAFRTFLDMIKFEHTIFALPFAYLGMVLAAGGWPGFWPFFWITVAMVSARTVAMSANRVIDRHLDARNPRTANRALPQGRLSVGYVWTIVVVATVIFFASAWMLNPFVFRLAPLALLFLIGYSYTKRFTWLCHWVLGITDGAAAAGAWAAITASFDLPALLLWAAVATWIAGFDLIYACQDVEVDRAEGLKSIPARFSIATSLTLAKINHVATVALLAWAGVLLGLGWPFWVGLVIAAALLVYENMIVKPNDLSRLDVAFFNINGYISVIVFVAAWLGVIVR
ncbi:MAG: UbiA-like polyprenyltransferase [Anaerolineae bacterium]